MGLRQYKLLVRDAITGFINIDIDSEISPFQMTTTMSYLTVGLADRYTLVTIYNLNLPSYNAQLLKGNTVQLYAGSGDSILTQMNGLPLNMINPKLILSGYIYDAVFEYNEMPNTKLVLKVEATPTILPTVIESFYKSSTSILSKNSDIISFVQNIFKQFNTTELYNLTGEIKIINTINDFEFRYEANGFNLINNLNQFLNMLTLSNVFKYPLAIVNTFYGYAISYDIRSFTSKQLKEYIRERKGVKNDPTYGLLLTAKSKTQDFIEEFTIPSTALLSPPTQVSTNLLQIHTILLPSIKPGDYILIDNSDTIKPSFSEVYNRSGSISSLLSKNIINDVFVVMSVSHNLNYSDVSPLSWSSSIELLSISEQIK